MIEKQYGQVPFIKVVSNGGGAAGTSATVTKKQKKLKTIKKQLI